MSTPKKLPQVTIAELRTAQAEMTDFPINREKLAYLEKVAVGAVRLTSGGIDIVAPSKVQTGASYGSRCGNKVRLLWAVGLAVLGADDVWQLTDPGVRRTTETREAYARQSVAAGK